jgi:hypothetical protein
MKTGNADLPLRQLRQTSLPSLQVGLCGGSGGQKACSETRARF